MGASLDDFAMPVHKCFEQNDFILGVQKPVFLIIVLAFILVSYLFGLVPGIIIGVVAYVPCRILTNHDPNMITIALSSLIEPDFLEG